MRRTGKVVMILDLGNFGTRWKCFAEEALVRRDVLHFTSKSNSQKKHHDQARFRHHTMKPIFASRRKPQKIGVDEDGDPQPNGVGHKANNSQGTHTPLLPSSFKPSLTLSLAASAG